MQCYSISMEQDKRDSPPLWLQLPTSAATLRQRRRPPPIPASLLIFIPLVSLLFIFFLISYFVSNTSQIFRINLVKNGWDLLNVVLVVFAILCGLAGKLSDGQTSAVNTEVAIQDGTVSNKETAQFSIFDEFNVSVSDAPASESVCRREGRREVDDESDIKVILVDTCVIRRHLSPPAVASKPKLRQRRTPKSILQPEKELAEDEYGRQSPPSITERRPHNNNNRKKRDATSECVTAIAFANDTNTTRQPPPPSSPPPPSQPPPSPPPPPPPSVFRNMFRKSTKPKRIHTEASAPPPPPPLPPSKTAAPPPPNSIFRFKNKQLRSSTSRPPQSIFNNILKSRIKSKRFDSSTATPPPPPPPPPTSTFSNKFKSQLKSKLSRTSIAPPHPPLPLPNSIINNISSTTPPPPPPYPPPLIFNNLLKFGTKSKRIDSSSAPRPPPQTESITRRSSKPPLPKKVKNQYVDATTDTQSSEIGVSNLDLWSTVGPQEVKEGNNPVGSVLCPSPDVNMKADKFIARLRSEWNLDKNIK